MTLAPASTCGAAASMSGCAPSHRPPASPKPQCATTWRGTAIWIASARGSRARAIPGWWPGHISPVDKFCRHWPSQRALAREIGRPEATVSWWLRLGYDDRLLAALMAADARKTADAMREAQMIDTIRKDAA